MTARALHLRGDFPFPMTACGREVGPERMTTDQRQVTCLSCVPVNNRERMRTRMIEARNQTTYGDSHFPGTGILKCRLCDRPYRDHPLAAPCPFVGAIR
jgi:hypothetical protein